MTATTTAFENAIQREALFVRLYKESFPTVAHYVAHMGGTLEEAQDIFQDTLIIYYEKLVSFQGNAILNEKAYLLGIAKKLWAQRFKANSKNSPLNDLDTEAVEEEQPATKKMLYFLETSGKKCIELLKAYYYDHLPVSELALVFGYSGTRSATVAKYKCLEKVRNTIKQKSLDYADFIE